MLRPDRDGMYCSKCGGKVETNAKFCGACGSTEPANSQPTTMSFNQAIKSCLHKYRDFSGRARRYEYWYFALFQILVLIPVVIIASFIGGVAEKILLYTMALVFLLPNLAVTSRRLHDIGKSGWLQLVWLLPTLS